MSLCVITNTNIMLYGGKPLWDNSATHRLKLELDVMELLGKGGFGVV